MTAAETISLTFLNRCLCVLAPIFQNESREIGEGCQSMRGKKKKDLCALPPRLDQSKSPTRAPHLLSYEAACPQLFHARLKGDLTPPRPPSLPGDLSIRLLQLFSPKEQKNQKNTCVIFLVISPSIFNEGRAIAVRSD